MNILDRLLLASAFYKNKMWKKDNEKLSNLISTIFDGGILENIPIITAYTTLHNEYGVEPKDIDMFVFGTGNFMLNSEYKTTQQINNMSKINFGLNLITNYITGANEQTSIGWRSVYGV